MKFTIATLGLAAMAAAAPASVSIVSRPPVSTISKLPAPSTITKGPAPTSALLGGEVNGSVGGLSGFVGGTIGANGIPFGCIGGVLPNGLGATLCAKEALPQPTAAPALELRKVTTFVSKASASAPVSKAPGAGGIGGQVGGSVGALSGFVGGTIGTNGIPFGCVGGVLPNGLGATICAKNAEPTAAPELDARQIGGALGGFIGTGISGTISGEAVPTLTGFLGGFVPGAGATIAARAPQIGGAFGGFVGPSLSGTASGEAVPTLTGFIGGILPNGEGATLFGRDASPEPTKPAKREPYPQIGGALQGSVGPSLSGFLTGFIGTDGVPHGCIGGILPNGKGATLCAKAAEPTA